MDAHYLDGYTAGIAASNSTVVVRNSSGGINGNIYTGTQGVFSSNSSTLSLGDTNGITLNKQGTNVLGIIGKQSATTGYIQLGNDTNVFGWNGTYLAYNNVYFRNGRIGIGENDPHEFSGHITTNRLLPMVTGWSLSVMDTYTRKIRFREADSDSYGAFLGYDAQNNYFLIEGNDNGTLSRDLTVGRNGGVTLSKSGTS